MRRPVVVGAFSFAVVMAACGGGDESTFPGGDAGDGFDGGDYDGNVDFGDGGNADVTVDAAPLTCAGGCPTGLVCVRDRCLPPQGPCKTAADCKYDTYCDTATSTCVPFGTAPDNKTTDPSCKQIILAGAFAPKIKCEFTKAKIPATDAFPWHSDVQATPMVANFDGAAGKPSIVVGFTPPANESGSPYDNGGSYYETFGIIRVLSGTDCSLLANLGGVDIDGDAQIDWTRSSSPVAVGDLDGDKIPEIVAYMADASTVAWTKKNGAWAPLWPKKKATLADGVTVFKGLASAWAGPSIHDLDDDGFPEVIREGAVIDGRTGKLVVNNPASYQTYNVGIPAVLANVDGDANVELLNGAHIWDFVAATKTWVPDPTYDTVSTPSGWVAVADFNPYDGLKKPEIVVAYGASKNPPAGKLAIYDLAHATFMNMVVDVPGGGGGPPTVADYDGDGLPEVGLAGADFYTVFDPDCQATPRTGGKCDDRTHCDGFPQKACPNHILWSKKTQDHSSNITGSSVFDFEGDGKAEVVYGDECFSRVYSGKNGDVVFSQYRSSCTWLENPIVADVDGDFRAELVVPSNTACGPAGVGLSCGGLDANGVDAQFTGLVCQQNTDCFSGVCDNGYCRCTTSSQCCALNNDAQCIDFGFKCAPPPTGTPGTGNTCRASHPHGVQGVRVYEDSADRWVRSRQIWNQHAYAVTHVNEDGTVPKTSQWPTNWTQPDLNNFRQNVPGVPDGNALGDPTSGVARTYTCNGQSAVLSILVCNRGTAPVASGLPVGFYVGTTKVCSTTTAGNLAPGACENVSCTWASPPAVSGAAVDVTVVPNDGNQTAECNTQNNTGLVRNVFCEAPR